jgi:mono/diheme cytochrome c family protein
MIRAFMRRPVKVLLMSASIAAAGLAAACGTERISIPKSDPNYNADLAGAQLFAQRCSGCHTLSYAATHGSAANPRTAQYNNGPNFDVRCERPITRVLYAIQNGGFSGAIMPQNVVVGPDAILVARFVATYAGRQATTAPGVTHCVDLPIGTIPVTTPTATTATSSAVASAATAGTTSSTTTTTTATAAAHPKASRAAKKK